MVDVGSWRELDPDEWRKFQRNMLLFKGGNLQRAFLESLETAERFSDFVRTRVQTKGIKEPELFQEEMTEGQFKQMPRDTEMALYDLWRDLVPRIACREGFWADLSLRHMEAGRIVAFWFAGDASSGSSAKKRVEQALGGQGEKSEQAIDSCVRAALRRLCGTVPRKKKMLSIYADCCLSRAWWRERWTEQIVGNNESLTGRVRQIFAKQNWLEQLVDLVVSRNSVFGSDRIWSAFVLGLISLSEEGVARVLQEKHTLRRAGLSVGLVQASRELDVLENHELQELMDGILREQERLAMQGAL